MGIIISLGVFMVNLLLKDCISKKLKQGKKPTVQKL